MSPVPITRRRGAICCERRQHWRPGQGRGGRRADHGRTQRFGRSAHVGDQQRHRVLAGESARKIDARHFEMQRQPHQLERARARRAQERQVAAAQPSGFGADLVDLSAELELLAGGTVGGQRHDLADRESARIQHREQLGAERAGCARDGDAQRPARAHAASARAASTASPVARQPCAGRFSPGSSRSAVRCPDASTRATASRTAAAASAAPSECSSSMATDRIAASGLADVAARDVRRRAVDRLVEAEPAGAEAGGRQHAERAGDHGGLVRQDVSEEVLGHDHVEATRLLHEQHGARVDQLVRERHVRVVLRHLFHDLDPELRHLQHVLLVDVGHVLSP